MVVSISKMSIAYYLSTVAKGDQPQATTKPLTAYYTETATPPGRWWGQGVAGLSGITNGQEVGRRDAIAIYDRLADPVTGQSLGRSMMVPHQAPEGATTPTGAPAKDTRDAVAGFDLTFSVPKSVSTLWAVAGPELQQALHQAHQQAVNETMAWTEREFIQSRAGKGGVAHAPVKGLIASMFDHWDSREGDPQLHTHVVVSNRVQRLLDNQWVTLDSYTLHRHVVAISETYNSVLFDHLHNFISARPEAQTPDDPNHEVIHDLLDATTQDTATAGDVAVSGMSVELAGVPEELIREFSQRSVLIEQRTDELIEQYVAKHGHRPKQGVLLQLRQQATLETRSHKSDLAESLAEKMAGWRDRTLTAGHDPAEVIAQATGHDSQVIGPDMLTADVREQLADWVLADTAARRSTFTRANLIASAQRITRLVRFADFDDRMAITDDLVAMAQDQAVALTPDRSTIGVDTNDVAVANRGRSVFDHKPTAGMYTTATIMDQEQFIMDAATQSAGHGLDPHRIDDQLANVSMAGGHPLSDDKIRACRGLLTSDASVSAVIGPAGTGKTSAMAAVKDIWSQHHGASSVVGLAPSAVAARVLGNELDVETDNVSKWLYESIGDGASRRAQRIQQLTNRLHDFERSDQTHPRRYEAVAAQLAEQYAAQAKYQLRENQLLTIDEASMVSTAQLAELTAQAQTVGAKVVLVGDPAQLGSVDAGGMLGWLDRNNKAYTLSSVWRFKNDWEGEASLGLRSGDIKVLEEYEQHGRIIDAGDDVADAAYQAWLTDTQDGTSSILVAADNLTVTDLNVRAQHDLAEAGVIDLNETVTLRHDTFAGVGDKLLARRNDRQLTDDSGAFITNGTRLILESVHADGSAVATNESTGATIVLDADYLESCTELGYAVTAHRAQGVTVDTAHCVVDETQPRELFYVAMTRGKHGNYVYTATRDDHEAYEQADHPDNWGLMFEDTSAQSPKEVLGRVLANETSEYTAHEIQGQETAWANDLGRLCHELEYVRWADRAQRTAAWVQETYPDESTRQRLTDGENWSLLVDADPAHHFVGKAQSTDTVRSIRQHCRPRPQPQHLEDGNTMSTQQRQTVMDDQLRRVHQELRSRRASIRQDPPAWVEHLPPQDHPGYEDALNKVLLWRAVADYDKEGDPLGPETGPNMSKSLRAYYQQAHHALTSTAAHDPAQQAHEELVAEHPDQVSQLHGEPVDFSLLDGVFDAEHQTTSVDEQTIAARQHQQPAPEVDWSTFDFD